MAYSLGKDPVVWVGAVIVAAVLLFVGTLIYKDVSSDSKVASFEVRCHRQSGLVYVSKANATNVVCIKDNMVIKVP